MQENIQRLKFQLYKILFIDIGGKIVEFCEKNELKSESICILNSFWFICTNFAQW